MNEFTKVLVMTFLVILACFFLFGIAGTLAVGDEQTLEEKIEDLETEILRLEQTLKANLIADCLMENTIRGMMNLSIIDLDGCIAEREEWYKEIYGTEDTSY